jgi:hypothetical protein
MVHLKGCLSLKVGVAVASGAFNSGRQNLRVKVKIGVVERHCAY